MKKYVITSIVIILVILFVPVFWLKLFQLTFGIGEDATLLIVAAIGLVGAILGGGISGALTLWGVKLTLLENKVKEEEKELPKKLENAEQLEKHLLALRTDIENVSKITDTERKEFKKFILENKLVDLSINLNETIYHNIKSLEIATYYQSELKSTKIYLKKLDRYSVEEAIDLVREEKEKILKKIFP